MSFLCKPWWNNFTEPNNFKGSNNTARLRFCVARWQSTGDVLQPERECFGYDRSNILSHKAFSGCYNYSCMSCNWTSDNKPRWLT